jgi:hypothetical protein
MTQVDTEENFKAVSFSKDKTAINTSNRSIPNSWYRQIVWDNDKPDNIAMTILAEVMLLHELYGKLEFHLGYKYFQDKFNYSRNQIRDALVRLEKANLLKRDYRTVQVNDRKFNNEMFLILNLEQIRKLQQGGA